jgi:pyruvate/2-oxoglutarate/acetoin dehydrogenase E1 component
MKTVETEISYIEAIRDAFEYSLSIDDNVIIIGEGVPDPKSIFNSTKNLQEQFGNDRIFDMPLSENGITGVCIGASLCGLRPVLIHQRIDFALLSLDQIINNAAKWRYMFNNQSTVPLVIRMIIGRGWGQGPQHSQSLQALFAHIPGLKVVMPATPRDAKGMMIAAIQDNDPVIFIEHRWLHNNVELVPDGYYETNLDKARVVSAGELITIATFSYMLVEAIIAVNAIKDVLGITVELIDMRSVRPLDTNTVIASVEKTGRLLVLDTANKFCSVANELISTVASESFSSLKRAPVSICSPDRPIGTSPSLSKDYYPTPIQIINKIMEMCDIIVSSSDFIELAVLSEKNNPHDVPYKNFKGPF